MKAKILSLLIESMTKERNIDPGSLPGSVANLLDACQRIEKAKTGKERVFSTTVTTFKEWLSNTGYGFGSGRPPKKETTYWTSLCVETMGKIDAEVFTEVVDETAP
jgi:hypothetical protein